ncbi:MAG: DUF4198 domain-containing protein [Rubripirellula sp.]|jgi:uncharacterized GH25 family protein|nr:DUF4198 domain-containing protein [Rubripirellula sp.]
MKIYILLLLACSTLCPSSVLAHDTWLETNTNLVRTGDAIYVSLKLGNHGNDHRDFKQASKVALESCSLHVINPQGKSYDLQHRLVDTGYTPTEGYWRAKFAAVQAGMWTFVHQYDAVVHYAPVRSVKSAKTFFVVSKSLDSVAENNPGFDKVFGHSLELVPISNPVTPMGPGQPIMVRLLFKGSPMKNTKISFIPGGQTLKEGFDSEFERTTDENGEASFTPKSGNVYLIVAHHRSEDESGENYESTKYSATLTIFVPEICPCCRH